VRSHRLICFLLLSTCCGEGLAQSKSNRRHEGVQAAAPVLIGYDRIVPLLDAIYEDVAAIQMSQVTISTGNPNSAMLDAVQQSFQGAFSANTMDALQNQANSQLFQSNVDYQSSLLSQLTTATQTLTDATTAMSNAATAKATADANATANPGNQAMATAQQQADSNYTNAQAAQTAAQAQVTALKSAQATPTLGTVTSTTPAAGANAAGGAQGTMTKFLGTQAVNPQIPSLAAPSASNGAPTLPPTQQMDTQIGLLWDRVMRLLSTFAEPDSEKNVHYELLRFYPSVTYADNKTNVIRLEYQAKCEGTVVPKVMDLYPRRAPVNIADEKVKDNSFSLAGFLGFGAVNASASYNREHLKMITAMSQASYMTGFGSGSNSFGWMLGKVMGDDTIAVGQREMYALIAVPDTGCNTLTVGPEKVEWLKADGQAFDSEDASALSSVTPLVFQNAALVSNTIGTIEYAQSPPGSPVSILVKMTLPIDAEARVIVNGVVVPRARDNFARGTSATSAVSTPNNVGIFEQQPSTGGVPMGTWARVSAKEMVLVLDPKLYPDQFPSVSLMSPEFGTASLDQTKPPKVVFNGADYTCQPACTTLPGLAQSSATLQGGVASVFRIGSIASDDDYVVISIPSDVSLPVAARAAQVVSSGDPSLQPWGPSPRVLATFASETASLGSCKAHGLVLLCKVWKGYGGLEATLDIYDPMHGGGALHARMKLDKSTVADKAPQLLGTPSPVPEVTSGAGRESDAVLWSFSFPVIAHQGDLAVMRNAGGNLILNDGAHSSTWAGAAPRVTCLNWPDPVCNLTFVVAEQYLNNLTDYAELVFFPKDTPKVPYTSAPANLYKLRSALLPRLTAVDADNRHLHGANLFFDGDQIQVGRNGPTVTLECPGTDGTECMLASVPQVKTADYVYLRQANGPSGPVLYPLALAGAAGTSLWSYAPPAPAVKAAVAKPAAGQAKVVAPAAKPAPAPSAPSTGNIYIYQGKTSQ
jgi:hypothetical protein